MFIQDLVLKALCTQGLGLSLVLRTCFATSRSFLSSIPLQLKPGLPCRRGEKTCHSPLGIFEMGLGGSEEMSTKQEPLFDVSLGLFLSVVFIIYNKQIFSLLL